MTNPLLDTKKWEPNSEIQTPTLLDNQHLQQVIQRPEARGYPGQFSRAAQERVNVKKSTSPRINPDSMKTLWVTVGLIMVLGFTSFLVSFNGLMDVAAWVGLPHSLRWTVPAFIDVSILAYSMAAVIHKARNEKVMATWVSLAVFTLISVVANAVHAIAKGEGTTVAQVVIGATIAAAAPIAVFAATEELSRLAFRAPAAEMEPEPVTAADEDIEDGEVVPAAPVKAQIQSTHEPEVQMSAETVPELAPQAAQSSVAPAAGGVDGEAGSESQSAHEVAEDDMIVIAQWVQEQQAQGVKVTGASIGAFIGKSPRTGANRLNQLRETMPELFDEEEQAA